MATKIVISSRGALLLHFTFYSLVFLSSKLLVFPSAFCTRRLFGGRREPNSLVEHG